MQQQNDDEGPAEAARDQKENRNGADPGVHKHHSFFSFNRQKINFSFWYFLVMLAALIVINQLVSKPAEQTVEFSVFKENIRTGKIKRVEITDKYITGYPYTRQELDSAQKASPQKIKSLESETVFRTVPVGDPSFIPLLDSLHVQYFAEPQSKNSLLSLVLTWIVPFVLMIILWQVLFSRVGKLGSGVMAFGQNKAQLVAEGDTKTTFADVAGADEAKEELAELVDFLRTPQKYTAIGGKIPKGVLLVGPPGTGKTLMARAVAGEAHVPFFRINGAEFVELFVGVGASRVRDLFRQAREKAPCIIFIDELDAIGKTRLPGVVGANDEREQTLNQLLVEMDGFDGRVGVIILAATNRPEVLDAALLRPGRFDRQVVIDKPDLSGRKAILLLHVKDVTLGPSVDLDAVARATAGLSGADLANIVNEAALFAVRNGRAAVTQMDFEEAIEKSMAGLQKKSRLVNKQEREIVAYHETGHAVTAALTPGSDPVQKITIVPRGVAALGYTMQTPTEDRYLLTRDELISKIDVLLGGRAAEQLVFGRVSTGAANDLVKATDIARRMITEFGMSEKFENVVLQSQRGAGYLGEALALGQNREYAETTQQYVDEQVARIIRERYAAVSGLLEKQLDKLKTIAARLLEKESIGADEFKTMLEATVSSGA
ncbi:MAG TPA: ATP-dependent zinc metalloprotease FtsH [Chitinivibrionales bacterium]|nr:ATP-dependent zinc metalloprotease FtsH [Chitinivibrionales bacterium]